MTRLLMIRVNKGVSVLCAKKFLKKIQLFIDRSADERGKLKEFKTQRNVAMKHHDHYLETRYAPAQNHTSKATIVIPMKQLNC